MVLVSFLVLPQSPTAGWDRGPRPSAGRLLPSEPFLQLADFTEDCFGSELSKAGTTLAAFFAPARQHAHEGYAGGPGGKSVVNIVSQIERERAISPLEDAKEAFRVGFRVRDIFDGDDAAEIFPH